jgi:toxic protein SymE
MTENKPSKRKLKIYPKYQSRQFHQYVKVPEVRLCGKWLKDAGFEIGDTVEVSITKEGNKGTVLW